MTKDSDDKNPENESLEQSPQLSPLESFQKGMPGVREIQATYEMIVKSRAAINHNEHWKGEDLESMAMLKTMLSQMEGQYRVQLENAKAQEKEALKRSKAAIRGAGGQIDGERTTVPQETVH